MSGVTVDDTTRQRITIAVVLALVTLATYWRVTQHGLIILDDLEYVGHNPMVRQGLTWGGVVWAFSSVAVNNWHPLTWLSHMLDCQLFGMQVGGHHLVNLLWHVVNTLLLFHVLWRMTGGVWPSAFVAAVFAWHPLHVESVAWVAERKDVLSGFFWMLTLLAYVRYAERPGTGRYVLTLALFALGLLSKPMVVTLPCVMLLLDFWPLQRMAPAVMAPAGAQTSSTTSPFLRRSLLGLCLEKAPFFACALASSAVTFWAQHATHAMSPLARFSIGFRVATTLMAYVEYVWKAVWPLKLGVFYPLPDGHPAGEVVIAILVLGALSAAVVALQRSRPYLLVGWLWYLGTLAPVIGLVQVGDQAMADRYTYIPLVGLGILVAWGMAALVEAMPRFKLPVQVAGGVAVVFWIVLASRQVSYWQDNKSLFAHALQVTGRNYLAETILGKSLTAEGRIAEAKELFARALAARPTYPAASFGLGSAYAAEGKNDEAMALYRKALQFDPALTDARNALGALFLQQGKYQEAAAQFAEALKYEPAFAEAQFNWSLAMERLGKAGEALAGYRRVLMLRPDSKPARARLAWILATSPDARWRNGAEALRVAIEVCEATDYRVAEDLNTLAAAYAEIGQLPEAVQTAQKALALAQSRGDEETAGISRLLLKSFTAGTPYREGAK